ncbi:methylaspartate mutase [Streptomyces sp. NPDC005500]|uniref:methylaspartate mutase n=1 Tax=Streptomyces sp. NPDC005500 TaxID=3155007 RepID=UPI0033B02919
MAVLVWRDGLQGEPSSEFSAFVRAQSAQGRLVVQPRMGLVTLGGMRAGLRAVKAAAAVTVGTITLDSFTRVGNHGAAREALRSGHALNGFPIVVHGGLATRKALRGVDGPAFPVQVRHGSAAPSRIMEELLLAGIGATEGGPVSYCLPYSRMPLREAITRWREACRVLVSAGPGDRGVHLESFGGCLLGQLCPPALLVACSVLECLFFRQHGVRSVSVSYAQQTNVAQDVEAVGALHALAARFLGPADWHSVVYTWMGLFPSTAAGASAVLRDSARLAVRTGVGRLIVKTAAEARRLPRVADNVAALEDAHDTAERHRADRGPAGAVWASADSETYVQARALIEAVLELDEDIGQGLATAFERGILDIPYCLHPDNANQARAALDGDGRLHWASIGSMPLPGVGARAGDLAPAGSTALLHMLGHMQRRYDQAPLTGTV